MAYTTAANVRSILQGDSVLQGTAADLSDAQIDDQIDYAQSIVDAALRNKYAVPFTAVPDLVANITRDLAAALCDYSFRRNTEYEHDNYPILRREDRARELLEWLRTGIISLDPVNAPSPTSVSGVIHAYEPRLMTERDVFNTLLDGPEVAYGEQVYP